MSALPTLNEVKDGRVHKRSATARKTVAKTAATAAVGARNNARSSNRGRARATGTSRIAVPKAQAKVEVTPPRKTATVAKRASTAKKASAAKKVAPKKRNSSELDDSLFKDVKVVLQKLEATPAKAVAPDVVFERLEEVKRSPMRVDLVCRDLIRESTDSESSEAEEAQQHEQKRKAKTPAAKKSFATAQRMTRSTKKQMPPPSPTKANVFAPAPERRPLSPKKQPHFDLNRAPSSLSTGTPQGVNPMAMLKSNLRQQVKQKMEERISKMPTSPYALLEGETETGSPEYAFTKVKVPKSVGRKSSGAALPPAAKYLTNTPLVGQSKR